MVVTVVVEGRRRNIQGSDPSFLMPWRLCDLRQVTFLSEPSFLTVKWDVADTTYYLLKHPFFLSQINKILVLS